MTTGARRDWFSGESWLLSPDPIPLAVAAHPFVTIEINPMAAERATKTYPRDLQRMYMNVAAH
jgi:hypothetical protein